MSYNPEIFKAFKDQFKKDQSNYIKDWIVSWKYVDVVKPNHDFYSDKSLYEFKGVSELTRWFSEYVRMSEKPDFFPDVEMIPLVKLSMQKDQEICNKLGLAFDWDNYQKFIGRYNAQDYTLQNFYPVPDRYKINTILDFGAGCGRQANLWSQKNKDLTYVGMEAIPNSYCIQHLYYSHLGVPFTDYVMDPDNFKIENPGIYHLPTWRMDLLPENKFDLIICSQVLSEINANLARKMIQVFHKILKPGGALYVRDPGPGRHKQGNKMNVDKYIDDHGFMLEFKPYLVEGKDLRAFPRIWRKMYEEVEASKKEEFSLGNEVNYYTGGALKRIYRKIMKRS